MLLAFRISSCAALRFPTRLKISSVVLSASALSHGNQLCARLSSKGPKSAAEDEVKKEAGSLPQNRFSSIRPLPIPPPPPKGTPPTISTHDIEKYVQPLYSRGWGLSPILPNGNGIAVLRKRFDFARAKALEGFLADLRKYEEKKQHHAKTNVIKGQHAVLVSTWTHDAQARGRSEADVKDGDDKTPGVTARDIRLAYALEKLFESALAVGGEEYVPHVRPEADRPQTVDELEGYT